MKKWYNAFWAFVLVLPWLWSLVALRGGAELATHQIYAPFYSAGVMPTTPVFTAIQQAFSSIWGPWQPVVFPLQWAFSVFSMKLIFDLITAIPRLFESLGKRWFKEASEL